MKLFKKITLNQANDYLKKKANDKRVVLFIIYLFMGELPTKLDPPGAKNRWA